MWSRPLSIVMRWRLGRPGSPSCVSPSARSLDEPYLSRRGCRCPSAIDPIAERLLLTPAKPPNSPRLAAEGAPQRRQPIERSPWQWAFLHRGESVLELLWRRHADQDHAHGGMRNCEARGGFGQARGKPLL